MDSNKIVFIPTAGNVEPYTGYIDEGVEMLKSLGYELVIIDISKYDEDYLKNKLSKVSEPLDIKSSLKEEDLPLIEKMADDIKASIEAAEIKDVF
ncbi:Type 1 glutamine amidotransferase-like domain-containing protein [Veillonella parvula]|nr:Type 1 glutamine amidotransferase-like domain-containing protein [Veillonella parvula]MCQ4978294.1 Type 1 glutamine amidotransferase-like domain-containing protein [Veillonella parvula]